jgi:hypothetical protein
MFCPVCKAEYRDGFTRCSDRDVNLVSSLTPAEPKGVAEGASVVWYGDDPVAFSCVLAALEDAGIPTYQLTEHYHLTMRPPMSGPRYGIYVPAKDASRAEEITRDALKVEDKGAG